jgi:hypothetical protein
MIRAALSHFKHAILPHWMAKYYVFTYEYSWLVIALCIVGLLTLCYLAMRIALILFRKGSKADAQPRSGELECSAERNR